MLETIVDLWFRRKNRIGVVGHRGSRATYPENTLAAFEHAIRCGADAVELDVVLTTDGRLAVSHDPVNCSSGELQSSVPLLNRVLELGRGNDMIFDIEAKMCGDLTPDPDDYAGIILAEADRTGMTSRIAIRSFEHSILGEAHDQRPLVPLAALTEDRAEGWVEMCRSIGARCVSPQFRLATLAAVSEAHAAGIEVMPWTVNDPADWSRLIEMGVGWIVTDDPAALVEWLRD